MIFPNSWASHFGLVIVALTPAVAASAAEPATPLPQAHAHNDYEHDRPLWDALEQGFCGVEADIHLVDGKLLVAHDADDVRADRTLENLYLAPLRERIKDLGSVYPAGPRFFLLIDIKTDGAATYRVLREVLAGYADMLSTVRDGRLEPSTVTVVISGNRPIDMIAAENVRHCGIDGRLSDLGSAEPAHLVPWVSDNWTSHFRWRGDRPIGDEESKKLREIVQAAHAKGRMVRFWATPDTPEAWRILADAGVDLINTDDLAGLAAFLRAR